MVPPTHTHRYMQVLSGSGCNHKQKRKNAKKVDELNGGVGAKIARDICIKLAGSQCVSHKYVL